MTTQELTSIFFLTILIILVAYTVGASDWVMIPLLICAVLEGFAVVIGMQNKQA